MAQAEPGLVGGGEGGPAPAVGADPFDAELLGQLGDGELSTPDAEGLPGLARERPDPLRGGALLTALGITVTAQPASASRPQNASSKRNERLLNKLVSAWQSRG